MSLIFRMLYAWLFPFTKPLLPIGKLISQLKLIMLPSDFDINLLLIMVDF